MNLSLRCAGAVWQRNLTVYRHTYKLNLVPNFFEPVFYLLAMGVGLGSYVTLRSGEPYLHFLAPGLVAAAAMNGATFETTYNSFVRMTFQRTYEGMLTTPVSVEDIAVGELFWAVTRAIIYGGIFLFMVVLFGLMPPAAAPLSMAVVALCGSLFAALGMAFTAYVINIEMYSWYYTMFLTPLFLFSGIFFPLEERFPRWAVRLAWTTPLFHAAGLMRAAASARFTGADAASLAYVVAATALLSLVAVRKLRRRLMT
jgi:lipooligosaccharide transport system permease protein